MIVGSESSKQSPKTTKNYTPLHGPRARGCARHRNDVSWERPAEAHDFPNLGDRMSWDTSGLGINTGNNGLAIFRLSFQRETQALKKTKTNWPPRRMFKQSQTLVTYRLLTSSLTRWAPTRYKWRYCGVASLLEIGAITLHVASRSPPCRERRNASLEKTRPLAPHMAFKERTPKAHRLSLETYMGKNRTPRST